MPTPSYIPLAHKTLEADAAGVTFGNIPQAYRDLIVTVEVNYTAGYYYSRMKFNADTTLSYPLIYTIDVGSGYITGTDNVAGAYTGNLGIGKTLFKAEIFEYSATNKFKTILSRANSYDRPDHGFNISNWQKNDAITSILIEPSVGSWLTGSTFTLYGVPA